MTADQRPGMGAEAPLTKKAKEDQKRTEAGKIRVDLYRAIAFEGQEGLRRFKEDEPGFGESKAKAYFGLFNQAIDTLLETRTFNPKEFWAKHSNLTGGRVNVEIKNDRNLETYALSDQEYEAMKDFAAHNPTHVAFFQARGLRVLPPPLRKIIRESNTTFNILTRVAPNFEKALASQGIGLSHQAITERLFRKAKEEGRDPMTDERLVRWTTKRNKIGKEATQRSFEDNRFVPYLKEALIEDEKEYIEGQIKRALIHGREQPLSPSILAVCPRREGYYKLGFDHKPDDVIGILHRLMGSSVHYALQRILKRRRRGEVKVEDATWFGEESDIRGSIDVFWLNKKTHEPQVIDLKIVSHSVFMSIGREGLLPHFKDNPNFSAPRDHDRRQVLIYMNDKREHGYPNLHFGNIVYIDADTKEMKEAPIVFEDHMEEAEALTKEIKDARAAIKLGKPPEPRVGVHCRWCHFLKDCEPGQEYLTNMAEDPIGPRKTITQRIIARKGAEAANARRTQLELAHAGQIFPLPDSDQR